MTSRKRRSVRYYLSTEGYLPNICRYRGNDFAYLLRGTLQRQGYTVELVRNKWKVMREEHWAEQFGKARSRKKARKRSGL